MSNEELLEMERRQLHVQYFGSLENPAIIIHRNDGTYMSEGTAIEIPATDIPKLGLGIMILNEEVGNAFWY